MSSSSSTATNGALRGPQFASDHGWMNDPNGLVYVDGEYHLFYQHAPGARDWGPMHWGHAVSRDLAAWEELPIALAPDELGWIFSGSIVADTHNRAGLSRNGETVLIAFFTHHNVSAKAAGRLDFEHQSMALSHDKGRSWVKHGANPILPNPGGAADFRDPCVFWHDESDAWIMMLSTGDKAQIYRSHDLHNWTWASDFDAGRGAELGLWECPSLCQAPIDGTGERRWVLIQSFHPGGRIGGSGTRYYIGDFDGYTFDLDADFASTLAEHGDQWLDWGPDNYATISWANLPPDRERPLVIGWMNNWAYANSSNEHPFRGRMTTPRELFLVRTRNSLLLRTEIALERAHMARAPIGAPVSQNHPSFSIVEAVAPTTGDAPAQLAFQSGGTDVVCIDFHPATNVLSVDRRGAHPTGDPNGLAGRFDVPRLSHAPNIKLTILVSPYALEIFMDGGAQVTTVLLDAGAFAIDRIRSSGFEPA